MIDTVATRIAAAFGNDGSTWIATSLEIIGSNQYVHIGDTLPETLDAFGECAGASCHATPDEICNGVSRWYFDDGSSIVTATGRKWQIG